MVHAMHVRRDQQSAQHAVLPLRQAGIGVVEHFGSVPHHLEHRHRDCWRAQQDDDPNFITIDNRISSGWKRAPVVRSNSMWV